MNCACLCRAKRMASNMVNCGQTVVPGRAIDNAGYWGGRIAPVLKVLGCMQRRLRGLYSGVACDMAVLNACIHEYERGLHLYRGAKWSNPFLEQCDNATYVGVHNKCAPSLPCLTVVGDRLQRKSCIQSDQKTAAAVSLVATTNHLPTTSCASMTAPLLAALFVALH